MSTLGASPSFNSWYWYGTNVMNQVWMGWYTMPVTGVVTGISFYADSYSGSTTFQGIVWNSSGGVYFGGSTVSCGAGGQSVGGQHWHTSAVSNVTVPSGTSIGIGWWRSPGGSMLYSAGPSGSPNAYGNGPVSAPSAQTGGTALGYQVGAYITYSQVSAPTATTSAASNISSTGAQLNGSINPEGTATNGYFNWGTTTAYGNSTAQQGMGSGTSAAAIAQAISGLAPLTTYHYQVVATSAGGTVYGADQQFTTLGAAPYAPTGLAPASGVLDLTQPQTFSWSAFSSPISGDTQASAVLQWRQAGSSAAWNQVTVTGTADTHTFAASTFPAEEIEWQVEVTGTAGYTSAWSALAYVTLASPPAAPAVTAPASGSTIPATPYTVAWSPPAGQTDYEILVVADSGGAPVMGTVYYDSGDVTSTGTSQPVPFPTNNLTVHVMVRVMVNTLWSAYADSGAVTVTYSAPAAPTLVLTPDAATGSISVAITNPAPGAGQTAAVSNDLWRFATLAGQATAIRIAHGLAPGATFVDYTPGSGIDYQYQAVAFDSFGNSSPSAWTD